MIRREHNMGQSGFKRVDTGKDPKGSKLEAKKQRVQASLESPVVSRVESKVDTVKVEESKQYICDEEEVPTGFLDEESTEANSQEVPQREEDVPTGFLDEEEIESPKIVVQKVDPKEAEELLRSREREKVNQPARDRVRQGTNPQQQPMRNRARARSNPSGALGTRREKVSGENAGFVASTPPKRSYEREEAFDTPVIKDDIPEKEPVRKGRGLLIAMLLIALTVTLIVSFVVYRYLTEEDNSGEVGSSEITNTLVSAVDSLYTDATKVDIKENISDTDIQGCINMLESYKNSEDYSSEEYDRISKEIGTISFFLQDRKLYEDLVSGVYVKGSEEYESFITTLKKDIYLYTVVGLADTMSAKINILETTSEVQPSVESEEQKANSDTVIVDETNTEGVNESNPDDPGTDSMGGDETDIQNPEEKDTTGTVSVEDALNALYGE